MTHTEYLVKYYFEPLADWLLVGTYRSLEEARNAKDRFNERLREKGYPATRSGIIRREETEID